MRYCHKNVRKYFSYSLFFSISFSFYCLIITVTLLQLPALYKEIITLTNINFPNLWQNNVSFLLEYYYCYYKWMFVCMYVCKNVYRECQTGYQVYSIPLNHTSSLDVEVIIFAFMFLAEHISSIIYYPPLNNIFFFFCCATQFYSSLY